jgi:hypothetical protein
LRDIYCRAKILCLSEIEDNSSRAEGKERVSIDFRTRLMEEVGILERLRRGERVDHYETAGFQVVIMPSMGQWTHDYPISAAEATQLGLPVNTDMPDEVMELMSLYPQPVRHSSGGVEYLPVPRQKEAGDRRR